MIKPGKDPLHSNYYRPISLTSCFCKVMERMVNQRLTYYLEKNKLFPIYNVALDVIVQQQIISHDYQTAFLKQ